MEKRIIEYITNLIDLDGVNVEVTSSQIKIGGNSEEEIIFDVEGLNFEEMTKKIEDWYILHSSITEYIKKIDKEMSCWTNEDTVIIYHPEWDEITFPMDEKVYSFEDVYEEIIEYFSLRYVPVRACYSANYIEVLVKLSEVIWGDGLSDVSFFLDSDQDGSNKIHYEISTISEHFATTIENKQGYSDIIVSENFTTLKIYNVNDVESISIDDEKYESTIWYIANCILFEISSKYGVAIELLELPEEEDEGYIETDLGVLNSIEQPFLKKKYDIDLINYYHRALNMSDSEFKYLAFYQILECIFDEVYQYETVQDVKQIMNSSWFSSYNDNDITKIIEEVDRYNKGKNDREKLKLVLEKYFKGEVHEPAYLVANKEISKIIIEDITAMKTEKEMNDLQKLSGILYDFRCECTHSNRSYPFRTQFKKTEGELENYISLVQKVAERVITNYPSK